jgi:uncharacterized SAM-binding protein YcdF (DUF218 family)
MSRWITYPLALLILLTLLWGTGLLWFITLIPSEPATDTATTDAIVVLTGGSLRLDRGFELLAQGRAQKMFVSGVEDGVTLGSLLHNREYRAYTDRIPQGSVTLGHKARSTVGNAEETAQWMAEQHVKSIRLVTGNYHIPRSVLELREAVPGMQIVLEPVFPSHFAHNGWWQSAGNIRLVVSEYHKFVASIIVHTLLVNSW